MDGTGVTTLVAFHGCPLNCKYCLNPQALSASGVWKSLSSEELFKTVRQDDLYFRATNGKITLANAFVALQSLFYETVNGKCTKAEEANCNEIAIARVNKYVKNGKVK